MKIKTLTEMLNRLSENPKSTGLWTETKNTVQNIVYSAKKTTFKITSFDPYGSPKKVIFPNGSVLFLVTSGTDKNHINGKEFDFVQNTISDEAIIARMR